MTTLESNPMRPQDWFGVAIRTLGVWTLLKAVAFAFSAVGQRNSWFADSGPIRVTTFSMAWWTSSPACSCCSERI
jgi:hypothetical protein